MTTNGVETEYEKVAEVNYRVLAKREEKRDEIYSLLQTLADSIIDEAIDAALNKVKSALISSGVRETSGGTEGKRRRGRPKKS